MCWVIPLGQRSILLSHAEFSRQLSMFTDSQVGIVTAQEMCCVIVEPEEGEDINTAEDLR